MPEDARNFIGIGSWNIKIHVEQLWEALECPLKRYQALAL
jgi:hypothetical protein